MKTDETRFLRKIEGATRRGRIRKTVIGKLFTIIPLEDGIEER